MKRLQLLVLPLLLILGLAPIFMYNGLNSASTEMFSTWQTDSDALVVSTVSANKTGSSNGSGFGLMLDEANGVVSALNTDGLSSNAILASSPKYVAYKSHLGFQGYWGVFLDQVGFHTRQTQLPINSLTYTTLLVIFLLLLARQAPPLFALCFGLATIGSPWLVTAAHSTYWVIWTWLVPMIFVLLFLDAKTKVFRKVAGFGILVAFFVKFACGYEFTSSLLLLAAGLPLITSLRISGIGSKSLKQIGLEMVKVGFLGFAGFLSTFILHSFVRGSGSIASGISKIYEEDILRRTFGSSDAYQNPIIKESLTAPVYQVLKSYTFNWPTDFLSIGGASSGALTLNGTAPWTLICLSLLAIFALWKLGLTMWKQSLAILVYALFVTYSWYLLAKGHSYIHTNINFILWYLLLAPVVIYVPVRAAFEIYSKVGLRRLSKELVSRLRL